MGNKLTKFLLISLLTLILSINFIGFASANVVWEPEETKSFKALRTPLASYTGPRGITIRSFSTKWNDQTKLKAVYDELLRNQHSEELSYLSYVDLIGSKDSYYAGRWYGQWTWDSTGKVALNKGRYIEIYNMDNMTQVEDFAHTLAHEYGHHYTYYYQINKEKVFDTKLGKINWATSNYGNLRNLTSYPKLNNGTHEWAPEEIAAEDYAQLLGSPNGRKSSIYPDLRDNAELGLSWPNDRFYPFNLYPQENEEIPLATETPGLYELFLKWGGFSTQNISNVPTKPVLALTAVEKYNSWWSGEKKKLTFTWTKSNGTNYDMEYTIVYKKDGFTYPLRTTTDSKGRDAIVGYYEYEGGSISDDLSGVITFWVHAKDKDGRVVSSNRLTIDLDNPEKYVQKLPIRLSGKNRLETAIAVSKELFPIDKSTNSVLLATGYNFPDALAGGSLGKVKNGPLLLVDSLNNSQNTLNEIYRVLKPGGTVFILGGKGAVSLEYETLLKSKGYEVKRLSGSDRYSTAVSIAEELNGGGEVLIATGENFPDSLAVSPYAAANGIPMILVSKNQIPSVTESYLAKLKPTKVTIIGGKGVVSEAVEFKIKELLPQAGITRLGGTNRYETAAIIAKSFFSNSGEDIYVATGLNFPDALAGSVLAGVRNSPVVLVNPTQVPSELKAIYLSQINNKTVYALGGLGAIAEKVHLEIANIVK